MGSFIPEELGLKFAIPLTFLAIIVNDLRKLDHVFVMLVLLFLELQEENLHLHFFLIKLVHLVVSNTNLQMRMKLQRCLFHR